MAKVSLSRIAPHKKVEDLMVTINGAEVIIKQYLPILEKVELINFVLNHVFDENGYASPLRVTLYTDIAIIQHYTNISLTETALNNLNKTYDTLEMNGILEVVRQNIPEDEVKYLETIIADSVDYLIKYNTSALGILKTVTRDYDATTLDAERISKVLEDPQALSLVKDVLERLG